MDDQLVVKYIRTKNKIRKIITYKENNDLRKYHENVEEFLRKNTFNSIFAKAYIPKSSIYKNAVAHMYNDIFLKMDIKDFFPSINHKYLAKCLYYEISKNTEISFKECCDIVRKCSIADKGLPLGLINSPTLANLYLKEFDGLFYGLIKKMNLLNPIYTRYADDLVVSFKYQDDYEEIIEKIQQEIISILKKFDLKINNRKTKVINLNISNHVRITGINITKDSKNYRRVTVGKKTKNSVFWKAIELYDNLGKRDKYEVLHIKGLLSFILSVEKEGMENAYSDGMRKLLSERGFNSLKELVDKL